MRPVFDENPTVASEDRTPQTNSPCLLNEMGVRIVSYLAGIGSSATEAQIHRSVRGRKQCKVLALRILVTSHELFRSGSGKKGDPFKYSAAPIQPKTDKVIEDYLV